MKKLLLLTSALLLPATAQAQSVVFKPYVGFDIQRTNYAYNSNYDLDGLSVDGDLVLEDGLNGLNIHVGNRFHENFGAEIGYFRTRQESKDIAAGDVVGDGTVAAADFSTDTQVQGFTLDALGYLPVYDGVELIGTAGATWTKIEVEVTDSDDIDESELGFRAGGGIQYTFTEAISARALARYQTADFDDIADRAWTYSLGLNYSF